MAIRTSSTGWWSTCSTTPSSTPPSSSEIELQRRARWPGRPTRGLGRRPGDRARPRASRSSTASFAAPGPPTWRPGAAPASGWRSSRPWPAPTAARSRRDLGEGRRSVHGPHARLPRALRRAARGGVSDAARLRFSRPPPDDGRPGRCPRPPTHAGSSPTTTRIRSARRSSRCSCSTPTGWRSRR